MINLIGGSDPDRDVHIVDIRPCRTGLNKRPHLLQIPATIVIVEILHRVKTEIGSTLDRVPIDNGTCGVDRTILPIRGKTGHHQVVAIPVQDNGRREGKLGVAAAAAVAPNGDRRFPAANHDIYILGAFTGGIDKPCRQLPGLTFGPSHCKLDPIPAFLGLCRPISSTKLSLSPITAYTSPAVNLPRDVPSTGDLNRLITPLGTLSTRS